MAHLLKAISNSYTIEFRKVYTVDKVKTLNISGIATSTSSPYYKTKNHDDD